MPIAIRPFRPSDREPLRAMTIEAFEGVSIDHAIDQKLGPIAAQDWTVRKGRHVDDDLDLLGGLILVAVDDLDAEGTPLGYVSLRLDRDARVGWIPNLAVDRPARNRGIGRILLHAALDRLRQEGMAIARIETLEHNEVGRHLYPSVGFQEMARQVHYALDLHLKEPGGSSQAP